MAIGSVPHAEGKLKLTELRNFTQSRDPAMIDNASRRYHKPSKYSEWSVDRFRRGFMPNSTVPYIRARRRSPMASPSRHAIDEYVQTILAISICCVNRLNRLRWLWSAYSPTNFNGRLI
jgi:hypothetical protein